jgi:myo-inositol-1(or 4)-monophosphatase
MDEMCEGSATLGTRLNGKPVKVRTCTELSDATLLTTDRKNIRKHGFEKGINEIMKIVKVDRTWGDAYGHMMVATGRADVMFDPILNIWDAAALMPVLQGAGGHFVDVYGRANIHTGNGVSIVDGLKDTVLKIIQNNQ